MRQKKLHTRILTFILATKLTSIQSISRMHFSQELTTIFLKEIDGLRGASSIGEKPAVWL